MAAQQAAFFTPTTPPVGRREEEERAENTASTLTVCSHHKGRVQVNLNSCEPSVPKLSLVHFFLLVFM